MVSRRLHVQPPTRDLKQAVDEVAASIEQGYRRLDRWVDDRWALFEKDVRNQLRAAGEPLSSKDRNKLDSLERRLASARNELEGIDQEIRWVPVQA
jgi:hypothetical protein